jgi:hypothetical protein
MYQIRINDTSGNFNSVSADVIDMRFWSPDFMSWEYDIETDGNVENDGTLIISSGYRQPYEIQLIGRHNAYPGTIPIFGEAGRAWVTLQNISKLFDCLHRFRDNETFIDFEVRSSTASAGCTRRLFAKPRRMKFVPIEGSKFTEGEIRLDFLVHDPFWYESVPVTASSLAVADGTQSTIESTEFPTQRIIVKVENTNGSTLSGITVNKRNFPAWNVIESYIISDSISASGDYFEIDHYYGTVKKYQSGSATDIIDKFSGSIFCLDEDDVAGMYNFIQVTCATGSAVTTAFKLATSVYRRADYDIS